MNTVITFGISSPSHYWSRVVAAVGRVAQYLAGDRSATWHMLVTDDFHLEAGGQDYRFARVSLFILCAVVGVPLSWNKTAGGETVTRVEFELLHRTRQLGISSSRTEWIVRWTAEAAASSKVHLRVLRSGWAESCTWRGHLNTRGHSWPLSTGSWCCTRVTRSGWSRPTLRSFSASYQLRATRHYDCAAELHPDQVSPQSRRTGQRSERTGIGGWFSRRDSSGNLDTMSSHWFSMEIREEHWPWVFARGSKPAQVISTLEALAVLVALMLYFRDENRAHRSSIKVIPTVTDNRGNGAALNKLITTKNPASAVAMSWN